jgi:hypothetical protein
MVDFEIKCLSLKSNLTSPVGSSGHIGATRRRAAIEDRNVKRLDALRRQDVGHPVSWPAGTSVIVCLHIPERDP